MCYEASSRQFSFFVCTAVINIAELEKQDVSENILKTWSVEEKAMEVDVTLLQQIEALERKVVSADVQVKVKQTKRQLVNQFTTFMKKKKDPRFSKSSGVLNLKTINTGIQKKNKHNPKCTFKI